MSERYMSSAERAAAAYNEYMRIGASVQMGKLGWERLGQLIEAVEAAPSSPDYAYIGFGAAWMYVEAAAAQHTARTLELPIPEDTPSTSALLHRATDRFKAISLQSDTKPLLRAEATTALAYMNAYEVLIHEDQQLFLQSACSKQIEAARLLLRAYSRFKDVELVPELHRQAFILLFNWYAGETQAVALPAPPRFRSQGAEGFDMLYWSLAENDRNVYPVRIAPEEAGQAMRYVVVPPALLQNDNYPSESGHGVLEALIEQHRMVTKGAGFKKKRLRETFLSGAITRSAIYVTERLYTVQPLLFEADIITGAEEAKEWYGALAPNYRFSEVDIPALNACSNPLAVAITEKQPKVEDAYTLGWLCMELHEAAAEAGRLEQAEDVFSLATSNGEVRSVLYWEAKIGGVVARLYQALEKEAVPSDARVDYAADLAYTVNELWGIAHQEDEHSLLGAVLHRLTACLVLATDPDDSFVSIPASPRQRGIDSGRIGCDVIIVPKINDAYVPRAAGRVRFADAASHRSLDEGVATLSHATLTPGEWEISDVLRAAIYAAHGEADEAQEAILDYIRQQIFAASSITFMA